MRLLRIVLSSAVLALALSPGYGFATEDNSSLLKQHSGGTLRLTASGATGSLDVQINYESKGWQILLIAYDGLVTFKKVDGPDGNTVVPDLAEAMPVPQNEGKTYVFQLRQGIRFSDGREVNVNDVVASFQRLFKISSPNAGSWYNGIVGADACLKVPQTCTLAGGVVADQSAHTVTFNLTAPDSEFFYKLAAPFASVLPADTPPKDLGTAPMPGTGPYIFQSYDPNASAVLVRNKYFHEWSADAQPAGFVDRIEYSFGLDEESEVTAVLNGQYDWMYDVKPNDRLPELGSKYKDQLHIHNLLAYYYLPLNTNLSPFNDKRARQAVSYAINRRAMVNLFGGASLGEPLCQLLPAGISGYQAYCPYTVNPGAKWTNPDLVKAKRLVEESGTVGQSVTLVTSDKEVDRSMGVYLQSVLNSIGYNASVKSISSNIQSTYIQNTNNNVQASLTRWFQDYPAPSDFLYVLFSCANFIPGSDASNNISGYCDQSVDAEMKKAMRTALTDKAGADKLWTAIDQKLTDDAPAISLFQPKGLDLVSKRVGNYKYSDQIQLLFSQVWVK